MVTKEYTIIDYILFFIGNLIGVCLVALISSSSVKEAIIPTITNKTNQSLVIAAIKGFGCGALMSLATYKESPLWLCILCVMGFILAGFNHCIADAYYLMVGKSFSIAFIGTVVGNILGGICFSNLWRIKKLNT